MKSWSEDKARSQQSAESTNSSMANSETDTQTGENISLEPTDSRSSFQHSHHVHGHPSVDYYSMFVHQEFDVAVIDLIGAFLHDGTQVVLQLYVILLTYNDDTGDKRRK